MKIRKASKADCRAIAELAMMAGEGIPAYFWAESLQDGQDIYTRLVRGTPRLKKTTSLIVTPIWL